MISARIAVECDGERFIYEIENAPSWSLGVEGGWLMFSFRRDPRSTRVVVSREAGPTRDNTPEPEGGDA